MRLINVDALDKTVQRLNEMGAGITRNEYKRIDGILFEMPTVDAEPVVRCKDCKWYERKYPWNGHVYECSYLEFPMDDNDYCSMGERKEE